MTRKTEPVILPERPNLAFEISLWEKGYQLIAGIDEAGRGAWAGPVSAAAVIFPPSPDIANTLAGVNDSKKLTPSQRNYFSEIIKGQCVTYGVGMASAAEIDQIGILPATKLAVRRALEHCLPQPDYLLLDFLTLPDVTLPQLPLVKGDARSLSIASASILAKTSRDQYMQELDALYPGFGFATHKGYGTSHHQRQLHALGPSPIHRMTFKPLQPVMFEK
jgi:ribonuclease HII